MASDDHAEAAVATRLVLAGRDDARSGGFVNVPPYRGSTVLFDSLASLRAAASEQTYGRKGSPTLDALAGALTELEGGAGTVLASSGLAAISMTLLALVQPGDHVLMPDSVFPPTRAICDTVLARLGVSTTYYDPAAGEGIAHAMHERTTLVYLESPGSITFEVQDVPAIARVARAHGAAVVMDGTWHGLLGFEPFVHGVDLSIHSLTKYVVGHSDALLGAVVCRDRARFEALRAFAFAAGFSASADDAFLALRGLRTLAVRLRQCSQGALAVADWLRRHPAVREVLFPALPGAIGHELWERDFRGAGSVFGVVLAPASETALAALLDGMRLFRLGYSYGSYDSLIAPFRVRRSLVHRLSDQTVLRVHVGLEQPDDLIRDWDDALARWQKALVGE